MLLESICFGAAITGVSAIGGYFLVLDVIKPLVQYCLDSKERAILFKKEAKEMREVYERNYTETLRAREKAMVELRKSGRDEKSIADYVDSVLPFPQQPDFSEIN